MTWLAQSGVERVLLDGLRTVPEPVGLLSGVGGLVGKGEQVEEREEAHGGIVPPGMRREQAGPSGGTGGGI